MYASMRNVRGNQAQKAGKILSYFLLLASCFLLLFSCAHGGKRYAVKVTDGIHKETLDEKESAEVYMHFLNAEELALKGQYDAARKEMELVINKYPDYGYLYYEIAIDAADQKHLEAAVVATEKALELSPKLVQARLLLAKLYSIQEQHAEAVDVLERIIRDYPLEAEAYTQLSREYIAMKRYNESAVTMQRLAKADPESTVPYFYLGLIYGTFLKQYDKAIANYQKVLGSEPDNLQIQSAIAQIYLDKKDTKKALKKLLEIEEIDPEDISIQLKIALVYYELGDFKKAAAKFESVLEANPESDKIRYYLGVIYAESGDTDKAIEHFNMVPVKSNFYKDARINMAQYHVLHKNHAEAVRAIESAIKERKDEPDLYLYMAALLEPDQKMKKTIDVLKEGVSELPDNEKLAFALAVSYDKAEDIDNAVETMLKVIEINPKNANALNYVGYTYVETGENLEEAENMLQDAASLKPNDGYILDSLGWLYFKKGDLTKAHEILTQAARLLPKEFTVLEHLGDVDKARNDNRQALVVYKRILNILNGKKDARPEDVERIKAKICEVGGC